MSNGDDGRLDPEVNPFLPPEGPDPEDADEADEAFDDRALGRADQVEALVRALLAEGTDGRIEPDVDLRIMKTADGRIRINDKDPAEVDDETFERLCALKVPDPE